MTGSSSKLGKYTLKTHLATGGMADIWLAEQAGPGGFNKELVIKRILPHFAEDKMFTTMFLDEARLAAQLSHPKIAQIYELGEIDHQYFIAMEYIPGIDLDVLLHMTVESGEPIPMGIVCKIMMDVLEALDYAHDFTDRNGQPYGLVHRDVSPHNVLVSNDGIVKLCDFGVAKAKANQTKTQPGAVKGKFAYMAPEQIQNADDLDRRADVFAAGIMFFELLAGQKPFGDELAAINAIIAAPHPDVRQFRPDVPDAVVQIIDRALKKSRDERYPDAHSMMRDIEMFVRGLNEIVGDRELAKYVRTMQGIPVTRHSQSAVAIDATADTGETDAPRQTNPEQAVAPVITPAPISAPVPHITDGPTEPGIAPAKKSNTGLVIVGLVVVVGILAAAAFIATQVLPGKKTDPKPPNVTQNNPPADSGPKATPSLLQKPGGLRVTLRARPAADLYVGGTLVGSTPFLATLPPGTYKVEFRAKDSAKKKVETIEVTPKTSSFLCEF